MDNNDKKQYKEKELNMFNPPSDFDRQLVEKIKKNNITPKPHWQFLLKDYVIWIIGLIALLIGALAVSVIIYFLKYNNWGLRAAMHKDLLNFIIVTLPYFWIILLAIFVFVLYYNFKQSRRGYRYPVWAIISVSILVSIILGELLFWFGLGQRIDDLLGEQLPLYDKIVNRQVDFWCNPSAGRLIGLVSIRRTDHDFDIIDPQGNQWRVFIKADNTDSDDSLIAPELYQPVDMIGQMISNNQFQAWAIRVVQPGRKFIMRQKHFLNLSSCAANANNCLMKLPGGGSQRRSMMFGQ